MTTTPRQHSPLLVNADEHPYAKRVSPKMVEAVTLHTYVQVGVPFPGSDWAEPCWLEVCLRSSTYWVGIVRSKLQFVKGIEVGDLVRFHPLNIYDIAPARDDA